MIFSVKGHVDQIMAGTKTQTRRDSAQYRVGQSYAIQTRRGGSGDTRGRILIKRKWYENYGVEFHISAKDAKAEGGYIPEDYEMLYESMHPFWKKRWAYAFEFMPTKSWDELKKSLK